MTDPNRRGHGGEKAGSPATGAPRGRRERRKLITRRELLAAGRRLFSEEGLYESRIEDLSRFAGVAKGTLYGYFTNKWDLMEAVVSAGYGELLGHVRREAYGARTYREVVARVARAHLVFFHENRDLVRVFHQVRGLLKFSRPESLPLRRALASYLENLAEILAEHDSAPGSDARAELETATLLFGAVSGIVSTRVSLTGKLPRFDPSTTAIPALVALVLESRGPRPPRRAKA